MELAEALETEGVESLEALKAKTAKEVEAKAKLEADTAKIEAEKKMLETEELLRKQITDLEKIKTDQGAEVGNLRKEILEKKERLSNMENEEKPENAGGSEAEKTEERWKEENAAREATLSDADWNTFDEALKEANPEVRSLAVGSEEGRAAFMDSILGSSTQATQETFRRPEQKKKLSIAEQIQIGLGKLNETVPPAMRPSGTGFDADRQTKDKQSLPNRAMLSTGSIRDMIDASKE